MYTLYRPTDPSYPQMPVAQSYQVPSQMKADPVNTPVPFPYWPFNGSHSYPIPVGGGHACCNHNCHPNHYTYMPPYPHMPPPPLSYYGSYPSFPEAYPCQYFPPMEQPKYEYGKCMQRRYDYDKSIPASFHCCGCPNHMCNKKEDKNLKIEEQDYDAENNNDNSSVPSLMKNQSFPFVWISPEYLKNRETNELEGNDTDSVSPRQRWNLFHSRQDDNWKRIPRQTSEGLRNQFPFSLMWMPSNDKRDESQKEDTKEIDPRAQAVEQMPCSVKILPAKLPHKDYDGINKTKESNDESTDDEKKTNRKSIPVKQMEVSRDTRTLGNTEGKSKDIPVKHLEESKETKPSGSDIKRHSSSPPKTPKLPPVCLRVDPLPKRRTASRSLSPPSKGKPQESLKDIHRRVQPQQEPHSVTQIAVDFPVDSGNGISNTSVTGRAAEGEKREKVDSDSREKVQPKNEAGKTDKCDGKKESVERDEVKKLSSKAEAAGCEKKDKESVEVNNLPHKAEEGGRNIQEKRAEVEEKVSKPEEKTKAKRGNLSDADAAAVIQSAYRGFQMRKWQPLQKLKQIAEVRTQCAEIKSQIGILEKSPDLWTDAKRRTVIGETIMSLLLKLDGIQGLHPDLRNMRKAVAKDLVNLQERLDSLPTQKVEDPRKGDVRPEPDRPARETAVDSGDVTEMVESKLADDVAGEPSDGDVKPDRPACEISVDSDGDVLRGSLDKEVGDATEKQKTRPAHGVAGDIPDDISAQELGKDEEGTLERAEDKDKLVDSHEDVNMKGGTNKEAETRAEMKEDKPLHNVAIKLCKDVLMQGGHNKRVDELIGATEPVLAEKTVHNDIGNESTGSADGSSNEFTEEHIEENPAELVPSGDGTNHELENDNINSMLAHDVGGDTCDEIAVQELQKDEEGTLEKAEDKDKPADFHENISMQGGVNKEAETRTEMEEDKLVQDIAIKSYEDVLVQGGRDRRADELIGTMLTVKSAQNDVGNETTGSAEKSNNVKNESVGSADGSRNEFTEHVEVLVPSEDGVHRDLENGNMDSTSVSLDEFNKGHSDGEAMLVSDALNVAGEECIEENQVEPITGEQEASHQSEMVHVDEFNREQIENLIMVADVFNVANGSERSEVIVTREDNGDSTAELISSPPVDSIHYVIGENLMQSIDRGDEGSELHPECLELPWAREGNVESKIELLGFSPEDSIPDVNEKKKPEVLDFSQSILTGKDLEESFVEELPSGVSEEPPAIASEKQENAAVEKQETQTDSDMHFDDLLDEKSLELEHQEQQPESETKESLNTSDLEKLESHVGLISDEFPPQLQIEDHKLEDDKPKGKENLDEDQKDSSSYDTPVREDRKVKLLEEEENEVSGCEIAYHSSEASPEENRMPVANEDQKLVEENQKLREMMEKLIEAGKEQLTVISNLNGRVKDLERKLSSRKKLRSKRRKHAARHVKPSNNPGSGDAV